MGTQNIASFALGFEDDLVEPTAMLAQLMYRGEAARYFEPMAFPRDQYFCDQGCSRLTELLAGNVALRPLRNVLGVLYRCACAACDSPGWKLKQISPVLFGCDAVAFAGGLLQGVSVLERAPLSCDELDIRAPNWWPMVHLDDKEDVRRLCAMLHGSYAGVMRLPHDVKALTAFLRSGEEMTVEDFGVLYAEVRPFINFAETVVAENPGVGLAEVYMASDAASREGFIKETEAFSKRFADALSKLPAGYFEPIKGSVLKAADYAERILTLPPEIRFRLRRGQGDVNLELFYEETAVMMLRKVAEALRVHNGSD